jgi:signal transduction histidine kinase
MVVGYLRVEVTDTGAGIAMENQENVFGEFSQFNRNKLQGGGLQIVTTAI